MKRTGKVKFTDSDGVRYEYIDHPDLHHARERTRLWSAAGRVLDGADEPAGRDEAAESDEPTLFKALHACGYALHCRKQHAAWSSGDLHELRGRLRDHLVNANIGLIYEMRRRSRVAGVDPDELTSEGLWTLCRAVDGFDPWRGFRFSTYACRSILHGFVALGQKQRRLLEGVNRLREDAAQFDSPHVPDPGDLLDRRLLVERMRATLARNVADLTPVERFVIDRRWLHHPAARPQTLESIGRLFELSKERVRQIQVSALHKLRGAITEDGAENQNGMQPDDFVLSLTPSAN